jgi:hypothetical protein
MGHRLVRVSVEKKKKMDPKAENFESKLKEFYKRMKDIATGACRKIKIIISDLIIQYTPELTAEHFVEMAEDNDIDRELLGMYFPDQRNESPFFIHHEIIGKYLGYSSFAKEGMKCFIYLIKDKLTEDDDYQIIKENKLEGTSTSNFKKNNYMITRLGFYKICIFSRKPKAIDAQLKIIGLYNLSLNHIKKLRVQLIKTHNSSPEEKDKDIIKQTQSDTTISKLKKKLDEANKTIENRDKYIQELENKLKSYEKTKTIKD